MSKSALSFVIQRCVPGASQADLKYASLMLDAALPRHTAVSIEVRGRRGGQERGAPLD